ncbi:MAG: PAS domain S-box protein, partial [Candidatus Caldatribacteriota bacterium]|nr:PAS domain S-box protein [Candidatus Caldatribacteriota bacterium]
MMKDKDKTKAELIKELKDSEEHLKILFDYAPDAYYINDLKGNFIDGNKAAERLMGYKKEELIGKSFLKLNLLSLADIPKAAKALTKGIMGKPTGPDEFVLNRKDNSKVTVEISTYPARIKGKTLVLGIARDITERKKAEEVLKESEEKYRTVFENTGTATIIIEEDKTISMVNTQSEKIYGYSKEEIENKMKWTYFVIPEDLEKMKKYHIARRKAGGKTPTEYEFRLKDKKGNIRDIFLKIGMIPNTKKSVASLIDITERKEMQKALEESGERLSFALDATNDGVWDANFKTGVTYLSNSYYKMLGYEPGEITLTNKTFEDILHPEDKENVLRKIQECL